nr:YncE family protein [Actinomycetota bacterium]
MAPSTRSMQRTIAMVVAIALAGLAAAGALAALRRFPGPQGDGTSITPYGMKVTPASTSEKLGERPYGMALSPDGDHVLIANAGVYRQSVMLVDARTGLPSQEIVYPSPQTVSWGVAWSPGGNRAYASDPANDRIHVFKLGDGRLHKRPSLELSKKDSWPTGVAVAPDGGKLYVAEMVGNALSVIDTSTGEQSRVPLTGKKCPALAKGVDPSQGRRCNYSYTVALSHDGRWAYVSNWGKKTVSVVNTRREELVKTIRVGTHPSAMVLNPANDELYVANTDSDSISVIDTSTNSATRSFSLRPYPGAQVGANPNALTVAPDGDTLYVANAGDNDIAVVDLAGEDQLADEVEGLIPTGWYPTGVALSPSGRRIYVSNAKGLGAGPNVNGPVPTKSPSTTPNQYIGAMIKG